jgi:hypothetical protein
MAAITATFDLGIAITTLLSAGCGAYLGAYLKKKGENLATAEDLHQLLIQVESVTQTTKTIEAAISDKMWNRQRQWELKRDAVLSAIESLGRADDALLAMVLAILKAREEGPKITPFIDQKRNACLDIWKEAISTYDEKRRVISLVCSKETSHAFQRAGHQIRTGASKVFKGEVKTFEELMPPIQEAIVAAFESGREELHIEDAGEIDNAVRPSSISDMS